MPAQSYDDEVLVDPDDLKMPERAAHRRAVDLLALAAIDQLGPDVRVFRDLNWYPVDGRGAMAPDIMVVAAEAVEPLPRSYRQDQTDGPAPLVVVEVPSDTDSFTSLRAKARRYQSLGATLYVVTVEEDHDVVRLGVDDREFVPWVDQPMAELGGLRANFANGELNITLPDGTSATSFADLVVAPRQRAEEAQQQAEKAQRQAEEAQRKMAVMADRLRALGVDPDDLEDPSDPPGSGDATSSP